MFYCFFLQGNNIIVCCVRTHRFVRRVDLRETRASRLLIVGCTKFLVYIGTDQTACRTFLSVTFFVRTHTFARTAPFVWERLEDPRLIVLVVLVAN